MKKSRIVAKNDTKKQTARKINPTPVDKKKIALGRDSLRLTAISNWVREWFRKRGRDERNYQIDTISKILYRVETENLPEVVLAACPAAGKTVMSQVILEFLFSLKRGTRGITTTHGQDVLRTQYANSLTKFKPNFSWELIGPGQEIDGRQLVVTLPHTIYERDLSAFANGKTILVIDEGHQMFEGTMIQTIIKKVKPAHIIILTGTPAPFVLKKTPMEVVPMSRLIKEGWVDNVSVELACSSEYTYGIGDFVGRDELKKDYDFRKEKTYKVLDKLLTRICKRIEMDGDWKKVSHALCKTMIVCRNSKQANYVQGYFLSKGVDVAMSLCESDKKSLEIDRFQNSKTCTTLVVVYRGILGFDYAEMCNLIDLSGTANVSRLFQMMSRIVRPYKHAKVFYKVVPIELKDWFRPVMNATLSLIDEMGIRLYNGRNFLDLPILTKSMVESDFKTGEKYDNVRIVNKRPTEDGYLYDIEILGLDEEVEMKKKGLSYEGLLNALGVKEIEGTDHRPGGDKRTTRDKWIRNRVKQLPLNITSFEFFIEANRKQKANGVHCLTTVRKVYQQLGYMKTEMTYEECLARFRAVLEESKQ